MGELTKTPVLDHGYIALVESWGSDERIVESARMSTAKGFQGWGPFDCPECMHESGEGRIKDNCSKCKDTSSIPGDEKLLRYLWEHKHATPFEMAGLIIEVQAPIFVFREWMRHRSQSYSELSARYTPLPDVNYVPTVERLMQGSDGLNRQAGTIKDAEALTEEKAELYRRNLEMMYRDDQAFYEVALRHGVPKELARIHLPVGRYSRMRASANLRNWLSFLMLRMDPAAQYEIRVYANTLGTIISNLFPRTWALFEEGLQCSTSAAHQNRSTSF